jgi:hypothetical protein
MEVSQDQSDHPVTRTDFGDLLAAPAIHKMGQQQRVERKPIAAVGLKKLELAFKQGLMFHPPFSGWPLS